MKPTPRNLFLSALFNGRKSERPPTGTPTSIVCHDLMDAVGVDFPAAHLEASAMADLAQGGHDIIGFDTVMPEFSVDQEAAALGCEVDWGDRNMMPDAKTFPYADFADIAVPDHLLEKPSIKVVLEAIEKLRKSVGSRVAVVGKVMGPWTLSYHMAGVQNFLLTLGMGKTDLINKMLRQLMPVTIAVANAQLAAGADAVVVAGHATGNLVGPYHYEQHLLPVHQEMMPQIGGPVILHVCGNCADRLELFADSGIDAYHFEWQVDAQDAVKRIGDKISLVGNINNPETLLTGTPEDVRHQARYAVAAGVHIIGPECAIPLTTPLENLKAIVAAVKEGY